MLACPTSPTRWLMAESIDDDGGAGMAGPSAVNLAGVETAMITTRAVPAPLPVYNRRIVPGSPSRKTLPTPWAAPSATLCSARYLEIAWNKRRA